MYPCLDSNEGKRKRLLSATYICLFDVDIIVLVLSKVLTRQVTVCSAMQTDITKLAHRH